MLRYMRISLLSLVLTTFLASSVWADCPVGDLNRNCKVNLLDLVLLAENWLEEGTLPPGSVLINEVMAHSHSLAPDWIELYNTTGATIDIGGWYLSDNDSPLTKYEIPNGTTIDAYDYIVFYEDQHFGIGGDPFGLSENGETAYLSFSDVLSNPRHTCDDRKFGASETNISFGLYTTSTGDVKFVVTDYNTPGTANAYPKVGPIVINEIMYNPAGYGDDNAEYIELHNITDYPVTLQEYDPSIPGYVPWQFTKGFEFTFPPSTTISAHDYLIVAKNIISFANIYGDPGVPVIGPFGDGKLSNDSENVELSMPGDLEDPYDPATRCYIRVDHISYSDGKHHENFPGLDPWPSTADGTGDGYSLQRIDPYLYGDDVSNWAADEPSPGGAYP